MSDRPPYDGYDGPRWPQRDLERRDAGGPQEPEPEQWDSSEPPSEEPPSEEPPPEEPSAESGDERTTFAGGGGTWNPRVLGERRRPTTAEQAVPWLIGMVLALGGIVIVLLALIFTSPDGLVGVNTSPSPIGASGTVLPSPLASPPADSTQTPTATLTPGPSPTPAPVYGPLEMVYLGRASGVAPVSILRRDFSTTTATGVVAEAPSGIQKHTWAPDGRVGAALVAGSAIAVTPGQESRTLAADIVAITFGWDAETLFAVRVVGDGANDRAEILKLAFAGGDPQTIATKTYPHPVIGADPALREAQFIDNGGTVRIFAAADGSLVVWILGAPSTYRVDVGDGTVSDVAAQPVLWSSDGRWRTALKESGGSTIIQLFDRAASLQASVTVTGLVSHIRWAPTSNEIVFTLGQSGIGGGVRQDLYVWDLGDGKAPMPMTSNGVSFGAEWLGTAPHWVP